MGENDLIRDPFEEYKRETDPSKRERLYAWETAIGLQAVDGLETSEYLKELAVKNIEGEISISRAQELIESYYQTDRKQEAPRTDEADKVSSRISEILQGKGFTFSPAQYLSIHRRLFEGIYRHAGKIRDYNISKSEWVLDGDTVTLPLTESETRALPVGWLQVEAKGLDTEGNTLFWAEMQIDVAFRRDKSIVFGGNSNA